MKNKIVILINGQGGVGKDTLCDFAINFFKARSISSIDPIKKLARLGGWDGCKDASGRKLLAELKKAFIQYNNLPFNYVMKEYADFLATEENILFVHVREPDEIEKLLNSINCPCISLLIKNGDVVAWGNNADDCVENFSYQYVFNNNMSLEKTQTSFIEFLKTILHENNTTILHENNTKKMENYTWAYATIM